MDALNQRPVELEDVGPGANQQLQPRVARSGIVDGYTRPPGAQGSQMDVERVVARKQLVLGQLDHDLTQIAGKHCGDLVREQGTSADIEGEKAPRRTAGHGQGHLDRLGLERGPEPAAVSLGEPKVRRTHRLGVQEAGERLVAGDAAGGQFDDRLEDRSHGVRAAEHLAHLGVLLRA